MRQNSLIKSGLINPFKKAARLRAWLKLAIMGPPGSVKTMSAILLAMGLGRKIAFIDTENGSACLYSTLCDFDVLSLEPPFSEKKLIDAIEAAVTAGYEVLIIDSYSHFWEGTLDAKGDLDAKGGNSFTNWHQAGKKFKGTLDAILQSHIHVIVCLRVKTEYVLEVDIRGRQVPRKIGLAPIMREGISYEFTTILEGDEQHFVTVTKDRTSLFLGERFQVTPEHGEKLLAWMNAAPEPEPTPQEQLAAALADIDSETLASYLIARNAAADGTVQSVSDAYAQKALAALPRLLEGIEKFRLEAISNRTAEPATKQAVVPNGAEPVSTEK
jgi:AAA domain